MKIYFYTQDFENYGTENEPYWKAKGGSDYILSSANWTEEMIKEVIHRISFSNPYYESLYIGHLEVCDQFLTDFEQLQQENDGRVEFPAKRLSYDDFIMEKELV